MVDLTVEQARALEASRHLPLPEEAPMEERAGRPRPEESPKTPELPSPAEKAPQAVVVVASKQKEEAAEFRKVADSGKVTWCKTHFIFVLDCSGPRPLQACRLHEGKTLEGRHRRLHPLSRRP